MDRRFMVKLFLQQLFFYIVVCTGSLDITGGAEFNEGDTFVLTCQKDSTWSGFIKWYSDGYSGILSTCLTSENKCFPAVAAGNPRLSFSINLGLHQAYLTFTSAHRNESSTYTCSEYPAGLEASHTITINVPITGVSITTPTSSQVNVFEGIATAFVSETTQGKPAASIQWYKRPKNISEVLIFQNISTQLISSGSRVYITESVLMFVPSRADHGNHIYCTAYNTDVQKTYTSPNQPALDVSYPSSLQVIQGATNGDVYSIINGASNTLTCTAVGGRPLATITLNCFNGRQEGTTTGTSVTKTVTWTGNLSQNEQRCYCQTLYSVVAWNRSVYVTIRVLYGPSKPSLTYNLESSSPVKIQSDLRVIEGKTFTVTCGGSDSKPAASYSWTGLVSSTSERLMLSNISKFMNGAEVNCRASNTMNGTSGETSYGTNLTQLNLIVLFGPKVQYLTNETVVETHNFTKSCHSDPGNPSNTFYQWTSNKGITQNRRTLFIQRVDKSHRGIYICKAWNEMNPTGSTITNGNHSGTFWLNVLYGSSISQFTVNNKSAFDTEIFEYNSNITIYCQVDSNPGSIITLKRDMHTISITSDTFKTTHNMTGVNCLNAGVYSCTAYNTYNGNNRPTIETTIVIKSPPLSIESREKSVFYVAIHDIITLSLTVCAYPQPNLPEWYQVHNRTNHNRTKISDGLSSQFPQYNLTIQDISTENIGQYQLVLNNGVGEKLEYWFHIIAQRPPEVPTTLQFDNGSLTHDSVLLKWNGGFNGGLEQTFYLQYKPQYATTWITLAFNDTGETTFNTTLTGLSEKTSYTVRVFAGNTEGNSSNSELLQFATSENPSTDSNTGIIIGAVGGSFATLVFVVVTVVMIFHLRRTHCFRVFGKERQRRVTDNNYLNVGYITEQSKDNSNQECADNNQYETLGERENNLPRIYDALSPPNEQGGALTNERSTYQSLSVCTDSDEPYDQLQAEHNHQYCDNQGQKNYENLRIA